MKKYRCLAVLCAAALFISLAACGTPSGSASSTAAISETEAPVSTQENTAVSAPADSAEAPLADSAPESSAEEETATVTSLNQVVRTQNTVTELPLTQDEIVMTAWDYGVPPVLAVLTDFGTETQLYTQLQERTGITFDFTTSSIFNAQESIQLMVAANELPDITFSFSGFYTSSLDDLIDGDIIVNLSDYESYMPNYFDILDNNDFVKRDVLTEDGNIATANAINQSVYPMAGTVIRQDWLDELGLDMPVTYDEFKDVLTEIKSAGLCQYPLWCSSNLAFTGNGLASGYDVGVATSSGSGVSGWTYLDGQVQFSPELDGYRDYIAMMADWYAAGLISPDFATKAVSSNTPTDDIVGGQAAMYWSSTTAMTTLASYEECDVQPIPAPVLNAGDLTHYDNVNASYVGRGTIISANCEYPELAAQLLDYLYSDDGILLAAYGVEGVSFEYDDNGTPQITDLVMNNPDGLDFSICVIKYMSSTDCPTLQSMGRYTQAYTEAQIKSMDIWRMTGESHLVPGTVWEDDNKSQFNTLMTDIEIYMLENILPFVMGERSMDQWDEFITELDSQFGADIETCTELYQEAIDAYLSR